MKIDQNPKGTSATETGRSQEAQRTEGAGRQAMGATASGGDENTKPPLAKEV